MKFGIRVPPCEGMAAIARAARAAEAGGFDAIWTLDSPLLAGRLRDPYLALAACAPVTDRITLGVAVTNPESRHPAATACAALSLDELCGGRMVLGIGSGNSAMRTVGLAAGDAGGTHTARRQVLRETVEFMRTLFAGKAVSLGGQDLRLSEARRVPIYVAATGPRMLELAGEIADGVIVHVGIHKTCVEWAIASIRRGAEAVGRDYREIEIVCSAPTAIGDNRELAIDRARPLLAWFYALQPRLLKMAGVAGVQQTALPFVYPDMNHPVDHDEAMVQAKRYVTDEAVDKFCLVGSSEECIRRIHELASLGVHHVYFRHYLTYHIPMELISIAAQSIIPEFH